MKHQLPYGLYCYAFCFVLAVVLCSCSGSSKSSTEPILLVKASPLEAGRYSHLIKPQNQEIISCSKCNYVVPYRQHITDGKELNIKPGDIIGLNADTEYLPLKFVNLRGTADKPIIITNCGGIATLKVPLDKRFVIKTENSSHFHIRGVGNESDPYGIKLSGARGQGLTLDYLSTNFEVDHVEISEVGFAGIMAKTDPSCDDATIRENFVMQDVSLHDNYIHDVGGEGFYIGNSFYSKGVKRTECGQRYPHSIKGIKVFNNIVKNSGWESIQVGSAIEGAEIFNNYIENYGVRNIGNQRGGIQIGEGTGGLCYNNTIIRGNGNGLIVLGYGDNIIFNNVIIDAGRNGVFCDERFTEGKGFNFINNTIINPQMDGIRIYADQVEMNVIANNIIVNPGNYDSYRYSLLRGGDDAYVYRLSDNVHLDMSNNFFTRDLDEVHFIDPAKAKLGIKEGSPAIDSGRDVSLFNIHSDILGNVRPLGAGYDMGAYEFVPQEN